MRFFLNWFSLFGSLSTLFCCALPSLLVALGMGAAMAGLVTAVPQLIWLSEYKVVVFSLSALMLGLSVFFQYQARNEPCPIEHDLAQACTKTRFWAKVVLSIALFIWSLGAFFAFLAPILF